tara:strand:+ start:9152 stop:9406 length:255 start_codon:yes stop_codon:yes gene_type:complete
MAKETNPQELSDEQLAQKREEISAFYKENITHLKIQLEYEEMLRDIEKARAERVQAQMFLAQSMAEPPKNDETNRKLKKVSDEI